MSDSLQPHELQHARIPCPLLSLRVCSNSCPSRWSCHPTISSCHPLPLLTSVFPSIGVFSNESVLRIRRPKYCSFSFSISPSNEYSGQISFRIDWLDCLAVQGPLKESSPTPQFKSINFLAFSFLYGPTLTHTWLLKKTALTRWTFVGKVMSLLFNMLTRLAYELGCS